MQQCSKFCYLKKKAPAPKEQQQQQMMMKDQQRAEKMDKLFMMNAGGEEDDEDDQADNRYEVDTNVISISFDFLKNAKKNMAMGDPIFCIKCRAVLNQKSVILTSNQYLDLCKNKQKAQQDQQQQVSDSQQQQQQNKDKMVEEEQKVGFKMEKESFIMLQNVGNQIIEISENEKVWICEFCGEHNKLNIEKEEIPQQEDMIYIVQSANQQVDQKKVENDYSIIFCIDNSGSMSSTTEIDGQVNLKHGLTEEEYNMLKQFIEPGDEQQMFPGQKKNKTFVSRKQCVLAAIENQLSEMVKSNPNRKVGLVTFNNEVNVIGDGCSKDQIVIAGDKLNKYEDIINATKIKGEQLLSHPLQESKQNLTNTFNKMEEKGQTALGPGLLSSIQMATQGSAGSMVIICTDGLANKGLGSLQPENQESTTFYDKITQFAKEKGIVISVITIKGEGCKMDVLGKLADNTNGTVTRVNPSELSKDFANILKDEIVGTKVVLQIRLHKAMQFRNEKQEYLKENGTLYMKEIGNATVTTKLAFEYENRNDAELSEINVDINKLKQIPFQAQIFYTTLDGHRFLRVLTQTQEATQNKDIAEQKAQVNVIHQRIAQQSAQYMQEGRFNKARNFNVGWNQYVQKNSNINSNDDNLSHNVQFQQQNCLFEKAADRQLQRKGKSKKQWFSNQDDQQEVQQQQEKGFIDKVKGFFGGGGGDIKQSAPKAQMQSEEFVQKQHKPASKAPQKPEPKKKKENSKVVEQEQEEMEDEDCDEALMINYKQGKF